jgi:hypothetical protein
LYELNNLKLAKEEIENQNEKTFNLDWLNNLKKLEKLDSINKLIVDEFIENIYIHEDRRIKIDFKYILNTIEIWNYYLNNFVKKMFILIIYNHIFN